MNLSNHRCFSGGAKGADTEWREIGKEFGVGKHIDFVVSDLWTPRYLEKRDIIEAAYLSAHTRLKRNFVPFDWYKPGDRNSYVGGLLRRDYLQVANAEAIYAIGYIVGVGEPDLKGWKNRCPYPIVSGGTGYAVQMAIDLKKPVYVFDQDRKSWFFWNYIHTCFTECCTPILLTNFAGIGTRAINESGKSAIRDTYIKTLEALNG